MAVIRDGPGQSAGSRMALEDTEMREAGLGTGLLASGEPEGGPCRRQRRRVRMRPPWLGPAALQAAELLLRLRGKAAGPAQSCCRREAGTPTHPEPHGYTAGAPSPSEPGVPQGCWAPPDTERMH